MILEGVPWLVAGVVVVGGGYALWTYNRLVGLRNQLWEAWSGVDVQLKRRHDLIPNGAWDTTTKSSPPRS